MSAEPTAATFLFTDIEGSTRLWEREPERMRHALAQHDALSLQAVSAHRGQLVKRTGDGIHAVFDDPADAVAAVLALQLALAQPQAGDALALQVRCGLHLGPCERRGGDFYGTVLNRTARIMAIAHGGQVLLSQAMAEQVARRLPEGASLRELGAVRLRDLASPERVHQLDHPGLRTSFPPLRSLEATPNNLSQQLDSFVGREQVQAEVQQLLARSRLLTLLGMGGIGKSRLSVQLGAELVGEYIDGVWLVELAPLTDPEQVPQAVAGVLGVKEEAGQPMLDSLRAYVRDKTLLIILDNCEHLRHPCAALAKALLQAGAGVKLLASSREALQVAGETVYPMPTLTVPGQRDDSDPSALARHEAVRLFVDRASAARSTFRLDEGNAAAVALICRQLDGIPLALELAAARTRALSVQAIATRLEDRFRLLVSGDRTVLPRQRTLRALIDWSFDLLGPAEQALFRRLAVFAGGWTLEAAEAVAGDDTADGLDGGQVLDLLAGLLEKSLVVMESGGERYRMLETVRAYAEEKLAEAGDGPATRRRHLQHWVGAAEAARPHLSGAEQGLWLARLDLERENFLAAHHYSDAASPGDPDPHTGDHLGLRLLHALRPYWINRGELSTGLRLATDIAARPGLQARDAARCMALFGVGQFCLFLDDNQKARKVLEECLSIAREIGHTAIVAHTLQPLGNSCLALGEAQAARGHLEDAVKLAGELGDPRELAAALNALGMALRIQEQHAAAEPVFVRAIALAREVEDLETVAIGLLNLVMVQLERRYTAALPTMLGEVLTVVMQTGSQPLLHSLLEIGAAVAVAQGRGTEAARLLGGADALRRQAGLRRHPADTALLQPWVAACRTLLGDGAFAQQQAGGQRDDRDTLLGELRQTLALPAAVPRTAVPAS